MKTIALIDTRSELQGQRLGTVVSTYVTMAAAFKGNDTFQASSGQKEHIRTKIVTLKERLDAGEDVLPAHLA
jgi:hypothetical protein